MKDSIIFKPVLWRLVVWKFIPFYVGWMIAKLIYERVNHYGSSLSALETALAALVGTAIGTLLFRKRFEITINEDNISGPGIGWFLPKETFSIASVDLSYRHKQSFYERISFYRTIRSLSGQKIMVADSIYGKPLFNELYTIFEQDHLQPNKL